MPVANNVSSALALARAFADAAGDGKITSTEYETKLAALVGKVPSDPEAARTLLDLFESSSTELEEKAHWGIFNALYDAQVPVTPSLPRDAALTDAIAQRTLTFEDQTFSDLTKRLGKGEAQAVISMMDTAFELAHPAFRGKLQHNEGEVPDNQLDDDENGLVDDVLGYSFTKRSGDLTPPIFDQSSHGTETLGVAVGTTDQVKAVLVEGFGTGSPTEAARALQYAAQKGRAVNVSLAFLDPKYTEALRAVIKNNPDVLFMLGAGNFAEELGKGRLASDRYLASMTAPNVVTVGSAELTGEREPTSNFGAEFVMSPRAQ